MKTRITFLFITLLLLFNTGTAQDTIANGGFEIWKMKEFKCCGRNIDVPWYWGITEQLTGINFNKFTFRIVDSPYVHSGACSIELYSDTSYLNNLVLIPGIIAFGGMTNAASTTVCIGPVIQSIGLPLSANPSQLDFYMKTEHIETDTASYVYLFTKWNALLQKEDTLAYSQVDVPDNAENMGQWISYSDTIHYAMAGNADTVRILFFGGRFGNSRLQGNAVFLDDVSFYYPTTGLVSLTGEAVVRVYPNPAANLLTVKTGQYRPGNTFQIFETMGRNIKNSPIESASTNIDISKLEEGNYFYHLVDKSNTMLSQGKFTVVK